MTDKVMQRAIIDDSISDIPLLHVIRVINAILKAEEEYEKDINQGIGKGQE